MRLCLLLVLLSCGSHHEAKQAAAAATSPQPQQTALYYEEKRELPDCDEAHINTLAYVIKTAQFYGCLVDEWVPLPAQQATVLNTYSTRGDGVDQCDKVDGDTCYFDRAVFTEFSNGLWFVQIWFNHVAVTADATYEADKYLTALTPKQDDLGQELVLPLDRFVFQKFEDETAAWAQISLFKPDAKSSPDVILYFDKNSNGKYDSKDYLFDFIELKKDD